MGKNRHSKKRLKRNRARIEPLKRFLIVCEGKATEPEYFAGMRRVLRNRLLEIEVVPDAGVPKSVVQYARERKRDSEREAKREKDTNLKFDEVWVVIDVDEHPNLQEAINQARDNGISLAISNPCFELWLVLHFKDHRREEHRHEIQRICGACIANYDKHIDFDELWKLYQNAVKRASDLNVWQESQGRRGHNPSTFVHLLTERILAAAEQAQARFR